MQNNNNIALDIKYSQTEIDTFQLLLQTIARGNMHQFREQMFTLNLTQLSRFKQFRHDVQVLKLPPSYRQ